MVSITLRGLNQKAVVWKFAAFDSYGQPKLNSPVEVKVRWRETSRQSVDRDGTPILIEAVVDCETVVSCWQHYKTWTDFGPA
ncbi:MAG: hypothetical protein KatS3mg087_1195 [Patescibacteria group bacterium]|nr:MAG: hypothetical protein KatS3mg087_1195 [Patescibacteria group bacterium]